MAQTSWKRWLQHLHFLAPAQTTKAKGQRPGADAKISEQEAMVIAAKACGQYDIFWDAGTAEAFFRTYEKRPVWSIGTGVPQVHWTELDMDDFPKVILVDAETGEFLGQHGLHRFIPAIELQHRKNYRLAEAQRQKVG